MDEAEALKKVCPLLHISTMIVVAVARSVPEKEWPELSETACCLGSACMWWRPTGLRVEHTGREITVGAPGGGGRFEKEIVKVPQGTCGILPLGKGGEE